MENVAQRLWPLIYTHKNDRQDDCCPEIAILDPNTLASLGLRIILEEMMPQVVVRTFSSFEALIDDTPDMYAHYFVASQIYFEHTPFFWNVGRKPSFWRPPCCPCLSLAWMSAGRRIRGARRAPFAALWASDDAPPVVVSHSDEARELSPREVDVLRLITHGYINKEIADKLNISLTTVISHRKNITEKLGIKSVSGLAIYAVLHGYVEVDSI